MSARRLQARCACGAVRIALPDAFRYALNCHCSACRRRTGSAFKPFGGLPAEDVIVVEGASALSRRGEPDAHDAFCGTCGSLLYSLVRGGAYAHVPYGILDDTPSLTPAAHICVASKAPWYQIRDTLPQHAGLPA